MPDQGGDVAPRRGKLWHNLSHRLNGHEAAGKQYQRLPAPMYLVVDVEAVDQGVAFLLFVGCDHGDSSLSSSMHAPRHPDPGAWERSIALVCLLSIAHAWGSSGSCGPGAATIGDAGRESAHDQRDHCSGDTLTRERKHHRSNHDEIGRASCRERV